MLPKWEAWKFQQQNTSIGAPLDNRLKQLEKCSQQLAQSCCFTVPAAQGIALPG